MNGLNQRARDGAVAHVGLFVGAGGDHQQVDHWRGAQVSSDAAIAKALAGKDCLCRQRGREFRIFERFPVQSLKVGRVAFDLYLKLI